MVSSFYNHEQITETVFKLINKQILNELVLNMISKRANWFFDYNYLQMANQLELAVWLIDKLLLSVTPDLQRTRFPARQAAFVCR